MLLTILIFLIVIKIIIIVCFSFCSRLIFMHSFVTDINECDRNPCHSDAQCTNTDGSFMCTCKIGYTGNGFACTGMVNVGLFQNSRMVF